MHGTISIVWLFSDDTIAYMAMQDTVDSSYLMKDSQSCKLGKNGKWLWSKEMKQGIKSDQI